MEKIRDDLVQSFLPRIESNMMKKKAIRQLLGSRLEEDKNNHNLINIEQ
jgi:hypothetical protein